MGNKICCSSLSHQEKQKPPSPLNLYIPDETRDEKTGSRIASLIEKELQESKTIEDVTSSRDNIYQVYNFYQTIGIKSNLDITLRSRTIWYCKVSYTEE